MVEAGVVRSLACGGTWTCARHHEAKHLPAPKCVCCDAPIGDLPHMCFECPDTEHLRRSTDPDVRAAVEARADPQRAGATSLWHRDAKAHHQGIWRPKDLFQTHIFFMVVPPSLCSKNRLRRYSRQMKVLDALV